MPRSRPVTRRRRLLGIVCDVVGTWLVGFAVATVLQAALVLLGGDAVSESAHGLASIGGTLAAAVVWLIVVLGTGRSIGDIATRVRFTDGVLPAWTARLLRFATGAGAYTLLAALPVPWSYTAIVLALVTVALVFVWRDGRGLTGWIGRRRLVDDRAGVVSPSMDQGESRA